MQEVIVAISIGLAIYLRKPIPIYRSKKRLQQNSRVKKTEKQNLALTREAVEVLILTLAAGMNVPQSINTLATHSQSPFATELSAAVKSHALGANLIGEFEQVGNKDRYWKLITSQLQLSWAQGAKILDNLTELNDFLIDLHRAQILRKVRSAGVKSVIPLGICFLPAFMLLVVVPLLSGLIHF